MKRKLEDLLYAPIGLVTGASQFIPELAAQGRTQVANAKMLGRMATRMGTAKAADGLAVVAARAKDTLVRAGLTGPESDGSIGGSVPEASAEAVVIADAAPATAAAVPRAEDLSIVDYDSLAASQVVPRLAALKPDELEAVRRYEQAHRGRKTILGRVAQLQS